MLEIAQSAVSTFVQSLNPYYDPPNSQPPPPDAIGSAVGIDIQGHDSHTSNCLQFTTLAGRAIAAYANLSPEINNALDYLANLSAVARFASDQFNAFTARAGLAPEPGTHRENAPDEAPNNTKDKTRKASHKKRQKTCKSATLRPSQLPNTSLALGALVGLSAVGASSASGSVPWVEVPDAETLGKVCHDAEYPCDKKYRLTKDIDGNQLTQPIGNKTHPFTGQLDGRGHTISNLSQCLIENLAGNGHIDRLEFSDAKITSTTPVGIAACEMSGNTIVSNIQVERAYLATRGNYATAAIVVGKVNKGTVTNTTVANCRVETSGYKANAGIGAGFNKGSVVNTHAENCRVKTFGSSAYAGIGAGLNQGTVTNTTAVNSTVTTIHHRTVAGIGAGYQTEGTVSDTTALNCTVTTYGKMAQAGIGTGESFLANVTDTAAVNCTVATVNNNANAGIGAGFIHKGTVTGTTAVNCTVKSSGPGANAGIGAGHQYFETVTSDTTAVNCEVVTSNDKASAGIGAGRQYRGTVTGTTAVNCTVKSHGLWANAGIGVGSSFGGNINKTTAAYCKVESSGSQALAGIGAGHTETGYFGNKGSITNTQVINSFVKSYSTGKANIMGGANPVICNATINGEQRNNSPVCLEGLDTDFCKNIAPQLLTPDCQVKYGANAPPTPSITGTVDTVPSTNMTFSSPGSATFTTPTTPVASPGSAFINGITLGVVSSFLLTGVAGVLVYRYYQRSSTKTGHNHSMPGSDSQPGTDRPLPADSQNFYELPFEQETSYTGGKKPMDTIIELDQQPSDHPVYENLPAYCKQPPPSPNDYELMMPIRQQGAAAPL